LLLQVNECAGELDEALIVGVIGIPCLEPEMLKDIVSLVIPLVIETGEIPGIARVEAVGPGSCGGGEVSEKVGDFIGFFHPAG
jgi:hypothetical protein